MSGPPAVIIVVRHGARLDAADKQWHLNSPTPYDPPLTYGGWTQSRALGARIANILRSRETDDIPQYGIEHSGGKPEVKERRRRHKVILHSSPFLRCIQTSIAITAGLAQNPGIIIKRKSSPKVETVNTDSLNDQSPQIRPLPLTEASPSPNEYEISTRPSGNSKENLPIRKSKLRIDAFLGEWLSPDYFDQITPPPGSVMMIASAKGDLLRRDDYNHLIHFRDGAPHSAAIGFPGGWGSPVIVPDAVEIEYGVSPISALTLTPPPRRDRTSSLSSVSSGTSRHSGRTALRGPPPNSEFAIYYPPVPNYAISKSDPIPPGYVAHSRDTCVDVDYQWDSMRDPQNWGTGGEYGEEWPSMHKRFRRGLTQLVSWYRDHEDVNKLPPSAASNDSKESTEDDTELVIILVTHGAGCNALIGALTNQPVLMDVGMASLTMAVRKPVLTPTSAYTSPMHSRASSRNMNIADEYDVKLLANTEHLRNSSSSNSSPIVGPGGRTPTMNAMTSRPRYMPNGNPYSFVESSNSDEPVRSIPSSFGSIRRVPSGAGNQPSGLSSGLGKSYTSRGLWAPKTTHIPTEDDISLGDDLLLNFGNDTSSSDTTSPVDIPKPKLDIETEVSRISLSEDQDNDYLPPLMTGGLWGSPRAEPIQRQGGEKRRWTVSAKEAGNYKSQKM